MERLTQRFANGQVGVFGCGNNCKHEYRYCYNRAENCPTFGEIYEKLAAYEDTGLTTEECKEAAEKQRAKKPIIYCGTNRADCPNCGSTVRGIKGPFGDYCSKCGKKLDWSA